MASVRLAVLLLVVTGVLGMATRFFDFIPASLIVLPLGLLLVNLVAALRFNNKISAHPGLLGFHLALGSLLLLVIADQLISFAGHFEITQGTEFNAQSVVSDHGLLYPGRHLTKLQGVRFIQGPFSTRYAPGIKRRETSSSVTLGGRVHDVGDDRPLDVDGYRFYTSRNMGFAPIFSFRTQRGETFQGAVHLPGYPLGYYEQGNEWSPPGRGEVYKLWLSLAEQVFQEDEEWYFKVPQDAVLVLMDGTQRYELQPGQSVTIDGGQLTYVELRSWMGYAIAYNPLTPWMLAVIVIGVLCLAQFYMVRSLVPLDIVETK